MSKKASATASKPAAQESVPEVINIPLPEPNATSRLFPDEAPTAPENVPHGTTPEVPPVATPPAAPQAPQAPAEPEKTVQPPATQAPAAPAAPSDETYLEDLLAKSNIPLEKVKVRLKVDGQEQVMSYEEAKMRVQLKEHLNLAGQKLGEDRRAFADERKKFQEEQRTALNLGGQRQPVSQPTVEPNPEVLADPFVKQLIDRVSMLEGRVQELDPVVFDVNRQRVAKELKTQGFSDFLDYIPKMEAHIAKLKDPRAIEYYDSEIGSKALYHELKSRDLMEQMANANRPPAPSPVPPAAPPTNAPIIRIDGGNNPSQAGTVDNYDAQYESVLEKWKQTRDPKLFRQLLTMRGAVTFAQ